MQEKEEQAGLLGLKGRSNELVKISKKIGDELEDGAVSVRMNSIIKGTDSAPFKRIFDEAEGHSDTPITAKEIICSQGCLAVFLVSLLLLSAFVEILYHGVRNDQGTGEPENSSISEGNYSAELQNLVSQPKSSRHCLDARQVDDGVTGGHCRGVFSIHKKLNRTIQFIENGVETFTFSDDPEAIRSVEEHVKMMKHMTGMGHKVHQHDPLFRKMFEKGWASKILLDYTVVDGGVRVKQTSSDACAIKLIQYHAVAVSNFVKNGIPEFLCEHSIPECAS